jgi:hypothetical protein
MVSMLTHLEIRVGQGVVEDQSAWQKVAVSNLLQLVKERLPFDSAFLICRVTLQERSSLIQLFMDLTKQSFNSSESSTKSTGSQFKVDFRNAEAAGFRLLKIEQS